MQFVLEKCLAQRLFDLALASLRALPTRKTHQSNNLIDVRDDTLDHDRRLSGFYLIEQLSQCRLATILILFRRDLLLGLQGFPGDLQKLLQELDAVDLARLKTILQSIEPLRQFLELRIAAMTAKPALELNLDLPRLFRVRIREH